MIHFKIVTSMQCAPDQPTGHPMDLSMDPLTDHQAGTAHTIPHLILDQISKIAMGTRARTTSTDKTSTLEIEPKQPRQK